ncbi:2317_t:CDS:1, partial [Racocetra fulgida]
LHEKQTNISNRNQQGPNTHSGTIKHAHPAQFNLLRNITLQEAPSLQSVNETVIATPPPRLPMTD